VNLATWAVATVGFAHKVIGMGGGRRSEFRKSGNAIRVRQECVVRPPPFCRPISRNDDNNVKTLAVNKAVLNYNSRLNSLGPPTAEQEGVESI